MSLTINPNYSQPSFGSVKPFKATFRFVKNQKNHIAYQAIAWSAVEQITPSKNLTEVLVKKGIIDLAEITAKGIRKSTCGNQFTNVFAYIADGLKAIGKSVSD